MPVLVVDGWEQLSDEWLRRRHAEIRARFAHGWDRRWLFLPWWVERMRGLARASGESTISARRNP